MYTVLCRNRVEDFPRWLEIFQSNVTAHEEAGLALTEMWRDVEDPDNVFFMFMANNLEDARAFIADPESAEIGEEAGVLDGECYFLEPIEAY